MKNAILVFSAMLLTTALGEVIRENLDKTSSGGILDLHLIGTADGLTFFYESNTYRTWAVAKAYCESSGMHLAKITSKAQLDMLSSSATVLMPNGVYFTGGRDADEIREFTWDDTKQPVPDLLGVNYDSSVSTYLSCLAVAKSGTSLRLRSIACTSSNILTLCST